MSRLLPLSLSATAFPLHGIHYPLKSNSITVHSDVPKSQCFTDFLPAPLQQRGYTIVFSEESSSTVPSAALVLNPASPDVIFQPQLTVQTLPLITEASMKLLLVKKSLTEFHKGVLKGLLRFA